jgi:hypothetical protein
MIEEIAISNHHGNVSLKVDTSHVPKRRELFYSTGQYI